MKTKEEILYDNIGDKQINDGKSLYYVGGQEKNILAAMEQYAIEYHDNEVKKLKQADVISRREQLIAFLRQQNKLHYVTIYENDFEFADKLLKAINCI